MPKTLLHRPLRAFPLFVIVVTMLMTTPLNSSKAQSRAFQGKLANGLEVVVLEDHRAPVVTHMVWYRVGSSDEPLGKSGVAHFLEHLMFKGTERIPSGEFSKIVAKNGGQDNAFTSNDITAYFQRVAKEKLPLVMEMEADRMTNLRLDVKDVETERKVILEERRMRIDNEPSAILQEQMQAALYLAHPYRIPIIGWEHEVQTLNREDALSFYKRFYAPNNAILVVAGDVTPEEVMPLAEKTYGKIPANPAIGPRVRVKEPEPQAERRIVLKDERAGRATLQRYYLTPSGTTAAPREAEALELLSRILGSSNTSRLYMKLVVEEKKASSASGWYLATGLDSGSFGVYAIVNGDAKLEDIEASMDGVVSDIKENGVTKEELERARNAAIADIIYEADNPASLARAYGWALATGRSLADVEARAARFAEVTLEDVQAAAKKYLDPKRSVTGYLIPLPSQTAAARPVVAPAGPGSTIH